MSKKLFVFDLDDTLIDNVHDYAEPLLDAARFLIKILGNKAPHVTKIIELEQEIDSRRVKEINPMTGKPYLYSMERFPGSLAELYKHICGQHGITPDEIIADLFYKIGLRAFNEETYKGNINPHALSVLNFLKGRGDIMMLCTKGDARVQNKKIDALKQSGINHFSAVLVLDNKGSHTFKTLASGFDSCGLWSVGNSYDSDIKPALEAGYKGIYIPVETWETIGKMDAIRGEVDIKRCLVLKNLGEIITRYGEL